MVLRLSFYSTNLEKLWRNTVGLLDSMGTCGESEAPRRKAPGLPKGRSQSELCSHRGCRPQIPRFAIHPHRKRLATASRLGVLWLFPIEGHEELRALVGKSAGAICYTLNLPYEPPYQTVIDAASKIAYDEDRFMSAWSFVTQWPDGTTVWRAAGEDAIAIVAADGSVRIQPG